MRLWKVDSKLRNLTSIGTISAPGIVNSLQIIAPRALFSGARWCDERIQAAANGKSHAAHGVKGLGIVVGVGQEPRLGRWMRVKGDGASNRTMVFAMPLKVS